MLLISFSELFAVFRCCCCCSVTISSSAFIHWFIHGNIHINPPKWRRKPRFWTLHFEFVVSRTAMQTYHWLVCHGDFLLTNKSKMKRRKKKHCAKSKTMAAEWDKKRENMYISGMHPTRQYRHIVCVCLNNATFLNSSRAYVCACVCASVSENRISRLNRRTVGQLAG